MNNGVFGPSTLLLLALGLAGVSACGSSLEPGVSLKVESTATDVPARLESDLGYTVSLERAAWNVSRVELVTCPSALRRVYDVLIPSAVAHTGSAPTVSGVPVVQSLLDDSALELAAFHPPAAHYCALRITFAAADSDAVGLDREPDMVGYTLKASGSYTTPEGVSRPFTIESVSPLESIASGLAIDLSHAGASLTLEVTKTAAHWFDGVDFEAGAPALNEQRFSENVRDSLKVVVR